MKAFDAFFLPDEVLSGVTSWNVLERDGVSLRWPVLQAEHVTRICALLTERRRALADTPVAKIVSAIAAAADRLRETTDETVTTLSRITGYSPPVVAETMEHMLADWSSDALHTLLRAELNDPAVLDHAVHDPATGKHVAAFGFPLSFHVFSGNVPGIAVTSIVRALLAKSAVLGKTASGEPLLPVLFAQALRQAAPAIAQAVAITYWPGGSRKLEAAAAQAADITIVYGGDDAVEKIRALVPPNRRIVVHGARASLAVAGPLATDADAADLANSVAAYDQQGCVSPHLVYVLPDLARAQQFARALAAAFEHIQRDKPAGRLSTEEIVAIRNARTEAEFAPGMELFGGEAVGYTVILDPEPAFRLSCLNRVLYVKPVAGVEDLMKTLPARDYLQSAGVAGFTQTEAAELARRLGRAGVTRITGFRQLPWPPMHWHHDGAAPLRELIYWCDVER